MKVVFFGTPDYVVPILEALHKEFKARGESPIAAVVTQEPALVGRKQLKSFSPVDDWAHKHNRPIFFNPLDIIIENIQADIGVLASYGKIIPEAVIKHFKYGIINIHPSLLPSWRGSSPIQASIVSGEKITGVTFMKLNAQLDHGPVISQFKDEIVDSDNSTSLRTRLFDRAAEAIPSLITAYINGRIILKEQDHKKATFARQLKKEDGFIPPEVLSAILQGQSLQGELKIPWMYTKAESEKQKAEGCKQKGNNHKHTDGCFMDPAGKVFFSLKPSALSLFNYIRAMDPWPGSWTFVQPSPKSEALNSKRLKILKAHLLNPQPTTTTKGGSAFGRNNPQLVLDTVQLEGKSPVTWKQFREGHPNYIF